MNIYALPGHKVKVTKESAKNGYDFQKVQARHLIGQVFTVKETKVGSSSTSVYLKEFPGRSFNSVNFVDASPQSKEDNRKHPQYFFYNN